MLCLFLQRVKLKCFVLFLSLCKVLYHKFDNAAAIQKIILILYFCQGCLDSETCSHLDRYSRVLRYVDDFWNVVDMLSYILLIAALHVRYIDPVEIGTNTFARNMFSLSLLCLYLRFLGVFLIRKTTGVLIIMIINMVNTFILFFIQDGINNDNNLIN